jgi:hypothetical protein
MGGLGLLGIVRLVLCFRGFYLIVLNFFCLNFFSGIIGNGSTLFGYLSVSGKCFWFLLLRDFGSSGFGQHVEHQFKIGHMDTKIFFF